mgnify:FL=1
MHLTITMEFSKVHFVLDKPHIVQVSKIIKSLNGHLNKKGQKKKIECFLCTNNVQGIEMHKISISIP